MRLSILFLTLFFLTNLTYSQTKRTSQFETKETIYRIDASASPISDTDAEVESLIRDFFISGSCLEIRNINSQSAVVGGRKAQIGKFERDANLDIGFQQGIVLTTGNVANVSGPNNTNADTAFETPHPNDEAFIEFEFKPTGDEISFNYVFASEEYPDNANQTSFVCEFNDSFKFYLKKVGTSDPLENIALIPDTNHEVTINNLNNLWGNPALSCLIGDYSEFYVSNFPGTNPVDPAIQETVFDGYTVPLKAQKSGLDSCEWYYMKIVIIDGGDASFDSAVFLEANSFADNGPITISAEGSIGGTQDAEEGCQNGLFHIERSDELPIDVDFTIELSIGGTATPGVDYDPLPSSVTIPAGQSYINIPVVPIIDNTAEGVETVYIEATNISCGCQNTSISSEINIIDYTLDPETVNGTFCEGGSYSLPDGRTVTESGTYEVIEPRDNNPNCNKQVFYNISEVPLPNVQNATNQACSESTTADFTLSTVDADVTPDTGMTVTYHATLADAEGNENALPNNYNSGAVVIFARITEPNSGCYRTTEVQLQVVKTPDLNTIENERVCDSDLDGQSLFDLTPKATEALGSQSALDYSVSFYLTNENAANEEQAVTDIQNFTVTSSPQTVYVRVNNNINGSCHRIMSFEFEFEDNPQANNIPISIPTCSVSTTATFNLNNIAIDVANGDATMVVEFFEDNLATTPIANPAAYETETKIVYGRVTNPSTGCYAFGEVELQVLGTPERRDQAMTDCATDSDNSGSTFNLTSLNAAIIGTAPNVTITYYTSFDDANANVSGGLNAIPNADAFSTTTGTLYARAEASYQSSFCHSVSEIAITVNQRPVAQPIVYQLCVESGTEANFNLASKLIEITTESDVTVQFYTDSNGQNLIANTTDYTSTTNTIFAQVVNNTTGCKETVEVKLEVYETPKLDEPINITQCKINQVAIFNIAQLKSDLESQYSQLTFSFFKDENFTNPLGNSVSLDETTTAYVRYDLNGTPCFNTESITLTVPITRVEDLGEKFVCISDGFPLPDGTVVYEPGVYEVIIPDADGCDLITKTKLIVLDVEFPNVFAPNGNGKNETFGALPNDGCAGQVEDYYFVIFDRWGKKVFETRDFLQHWSGFVDGEIQSGSYLWQAKYTFQGKSYNRKGTVMLLF